MLTITKQAQYKAAQTSYLTTHFSLSTKMQQMLQANNLLIADENIALVNYDNYCAIYSSNTLSVEQIVKLVSSIQCCLTFYSNSTACYDSINGTTTTQRLDAQAAVYAVFNNN